MVSCQQNLQNFNGGIRVSCRISPFGGGVEGLGGGGSLGVGGLRVIKNKVSNIWGGE